MTGSSYRNILTNSTIVGAIPITESLSYSELLIEKIDDDNFSTFLNKST